MFDFHVYFKPIMWGFKYDAFNQSRPYLGRRYHQLWIGPLVFEWATIREHFDPWG